MGNYDELKMAVEMLSGGKNTVLLDDVGLPGIYVIVPKGYSGNVIKNGDTSRVHPAFKVDGVEKDKFYYSKYVNFVYNSRAYSLPMRTGSVWVNQANAKAYCTNKGKGFHLSTMPEWAYIALWARKNGTMPHGNNNYGKDANYPYETGQAGTLNGTTINQILGGSGPVTWAHNHQNDGIYDLNGNLYEWQDGLRLVDGEIQIIANNDAAQGADCDTGATSTLWKAIMPDGTLVDPGTAGALHYDWLNSKITLSTSTTDTTDTARNTGYTSFDLASGVSCPDLIKDLILYPDDPGQDYGGDTRYTNHTGERLPICGGSWTNGAGAGVFCVSLRYPRSNAYDGLGFRSAFVDL